MQNLRGPSVHPMGRLEAYHLEGRKMRYREADQPVWGPTGAEASVHPQEDHQEPAESKPQTANPRQLWPVLWAEWAGQGLLAPVLGTPATLIGSCSNLPLD